MMLKCQRKALRDLLAPRTDGDGREFVVAIGLVERCHRDSPARSLLKKYTERLLVRHRKKCQGVRCLEPLLVDLRVLVVKLASCVGGLHGLLGR